MAMQNVVTETVVPVRWNPQYDSYLQSARWRNLKRLKMIETRGLCEVCHRRGGSHLHHNTYDRIFNERLSDLNLLCATCHKEAHLPDEKLREKLLIR